MSRALDILLIATLVFMSACHKEGSRAAGERGLPVQVQVRFVLRSGPTVTLSTNASQRLVATLRSEARYIDGRGLTAASYGKFIVTGREFFLFHGLISDDLYLHGRAWKADWIDSGFSFWSTNGLPETGDDWRVSLESLLCGKEAQQGAAANQR